MNNNITITIHHLGPIQDCTFSVRPFTVLTGPQASGKSTLAKAVYFFLTVKEDIREAALMPDSDDDSIAMTLEQALNRRLRSKFLSLFGTSWVMPDDMTISCQFSKEISMKLYLKPGNADYQNFVYTDYSPRLSQALHEFSQKKYSDDPVSIRRYWNDIFGFDEDVIYIPAGREMITLLTDVLGSLITLHPEIARKIDYSTRRYISMILSLRSDFDRGTEGLLKKKQYETTERIDFSSAGRMQQIMDRILQGRYQYSDGEEKLLIGQPDERRYVKINYASSGQQEAVWVLNILYYYLLDPGNVFVIVEEPESHLYPDAQKDILEALALFGNKGNSVLITTHSPYILGAMNTLLYAEGVSDSPEREKIVSSDLILRAENLAAGYLKDGRIQNILNDGLISNEVIDEASSTINAATDALMELKWKENARGEISDR